MKQRKMPKPVARQFSGEVDASGYAEDPGMWLEHFQLVARSNAWDTDDKKITNVPISFIGEAETWYMVNAAWINGNGRKWDEIKDRFIQRFRPNNYQEELEERLRTTVQKQGESVRAYEDRYRRLHVQANVTGLMLNSCRKYWIAGLRESLKMEIKLRAPTTFDNAVEHAMTIEATEMEITREANKIKSSKKVLPKQKGRSIDVDVAE